MDVFVIMMASRLAVHWQYQVLAVEQKLPVEEGTVKDKSRLLRHFS